MTDLTTSQRRFLTAVRDGTVEHVRGSIRTSGFVCDRIHTGEHSWTVVTKYTTNRAVVDGWATFRDGAWRLTAKGMAVINEGDL